MQKNTQTADEYTSHILHAVKRKLAVPCPCETHVEWMELMDCERMEYIEKILEALRPKRRVVPATKQRTSTERRKTIGVTRLELRPEEKTELTTVHRNEQAEKSLSGTIASELVNVSKEDMPVLCDRLRSSQHCFRLITIGKSTNPPH